MHPLSKLLLLLFLLPSCTIFKSRETRSAQIIKHEVIHSPVFTKAFTGFSLLDPVTGKTLADFNGDHYFTPASNTKILTLATCLTVLGDSVPGLQYRYPGNEFRGTGDPTFLHPAFEAWQQAFLELKKPKSHLSVLDERFYDKNYAPGWAWDDYLESYQVGRSSFPIYGNCIKVSETGDSLNPLKIEPPYYRKEMWEKGIQDSFKGQSGSPIAQTNATLTERYIPIIQVYHFTEILEDTLKQSVLDFAYSASNTKWKTLYSTPIDTVLRRMMHQSDNFIAEQMLLVCAGVKFDRLQQDTMIQWMLDSTLSSLPQRPKWVDGSGLSRYNLMTPQSLTQVLSKLWKEQSHERILSLFPAGGVSGTISDWYAGKDSKPYIFAKTGSMSGVNCLSGYVVCKSGKVLIFSFMHTNYVGTSRAWKAEMQRILEQIRDRF